MSKDANSSFAEVNGGAKVRKERYLARNALQTYEKDMVHKFIRILFYSIFIFISLFFLLFRKIESYIWDWKIFYKFLEFIERMKKKEWKIEVWQEDKLLLNKLNWKKLHLNFIYLILLYLFISFNFQEFRKYWNQRYRLFSKLDEGILMDKGNFVLSCFISQIFISFTIFIVFFSQKVGFPLHQK